MNKALELAWEVEKELARFRDEELEGILESVPVEWQNSQYAAYATDPGALYYRWLYCLVKMLKPRQVIELGGAQGVSTLFMSAAMPKSGKLISVDLSNDWRILAADNNVIKIVGRSEDLGIYPDWVKLEKTDIWFIDTNHFQEQMELEFANLSPYWKKGTIIVLDDIGYYDARPQHDLYKFWPTITYDKVSLPHLHDSGFGLIVV